MFRIIKRDTLNKLIEQGREQGRKEGMASLIECIKNFAKDDTKYYFAPVQTNDLSVNGDAFFVDIRCTQANVMGNVQSSVFHVSS
jgi:hypothetical protein